jgi:hypothetical protein
MAATFAGADTVGTAVTSENAPATIAPITIERIASSLRHSPADLSGLTGINKPASGSCTDAAARAVAGANGAACHVRRQAALAVPLRVFAEFERAMSRERVLAGLARAREQGTRLGRRRLEDADAGKVEAIRRARARGLGIRRIARDLQVGVGTVLRVTGAQA